MSESQQRTNGYLSAEFRKMLPTLVLTVLTALGTSWWNTQISQNDLRNRIEKIEEKAETNARNTAQNSQAVQQQAIRIAEIGVIQNNTLEQIKDIKQEQNEIKVLLQKR